MNNPDDIYEKSMKAAEDWADKDHAAGILEDYLDALRGELSAELKANGESVTLIRDLTRKDPKWVHSTRKWREAKREALIAKLKYEQINRWQDNIRTNQVTERQLAR